MIFDFLDDLVDLVDDIIGGGGGPDGTNPGQVSSHENSGALHFGGYGTCFCGCVSFDGLGQICNLCGHPYPSH